MTDIGKQRDQMAKAHQAERLLNDPMISGAFSGLREQLLKEWEHTELDDTERREDIWRCLKLLGRLQQSFNQHVNTGRFVERELSKLR